MQKYCFGFKCSLCTLFKFYTYIFSDSIGIPSHVHSTTLISGAEVFNRIRLHTRSVCIYFVFEIFHSPRIRIYRFELKIAHFVQEFYEMCDVPDFELNLIWRFVRQTKFQMQCQMIYLNTLLQPQPQRIAYFTPLALWWWRQQQQLRCLLQMSLVSHSCRRHTHNVCKHTWMHNKTVNSNRISE